MMKINKTTCVALLFTSAFGTQVCAESFSEALQNGKFSAEIRNRLVLGSHTDANGEAGASNNAKVGNSAISVLYETAEFNGLKFGLGFQSGHDWNLHDPSTGASAAGGEDDSRNSVTSTSLEKAYIDYKFDKSVTNTHIRLGRQQIVSPLLMNSGMFAVKDSFDAAMITNKDLPDTTFKLIYVDQWVKRYGDDAVDGSAVQQDAEFEDNGLYSIYLNNKSIPGLNIEAQWLSNDNNATAGDPPTNHTGASADPYETTFLGLTYKLPKTPFVLGAKVLGADYDNNPDTGYWGVTAKTKLDNFDIALGYTSVDDDASFPGTIGHVPQFRQYVGASLTNEIFAGMDTTTLTVGSGFGVKGLYARATYAMWDQSDEGIANSGKNFDGGSELAFDIKYKFQGVKGLSTRLMLTQMDYDRNDVNDDDLTYARIFLDYKF